MSEFKHTEEPWELCGNEIGTRSNSNDQSFNIMRSIAHIDMIDFDNYEANASRIVACVNYCVGLENGEMNIANESGNVAAVMIKALLEQRDELLVALKYHQEQTRPIQKTIDAIAKAEVQS